MTDILLGIILAFMLFICVRDIVIDFFKNNGKKVVKTFDKYNDFEADFKFLFLIMDRERKISEEYSIKTMSMQLQEKFIRDDDLEKIIQTTTETIINRLSLKYIDFLVDKYFADKDEFIKFVTEETSIYLINSGISENAKKAKNQLMTNNSDAISKLNK